MKIKNVTIGIKSLDQNMKEILHVVKEAKHGRFPKTPLRGTYFISLEAMLSVLTTKRLELLKLIREKQPDSIYELAQLSGRHLKNIQEDISLLNRLDLVSLGRKSHARSKTTPRVDYDQLNLHIPFI
jgi:predicted transcriptional regulator